MIGHVAIPGDVNNDGKVDAVNLGILATHYGEVKLLVLALPSIAGLLLTDLYRVVA